MLELFPDGKLPACVTSMIYKDAQGQVKVTKQKITPCEIDMTSSLGFCYPGAKYSYPDGTFNGLCMSVHVAQKPNPFIAGFHLAGVETRGALGFLSRTQLNAAMEELKSNELILPSLSSGEVLKTQYGIDYFEGTDIHPKSAVNFLLPGSHLRYFGQVKGKAKPTSSVIPTLITKDIEELFSVKNVWGPPKLRNIASSGHYPFQKTLVHLAKPSIGMSSSLLKYAFTDYVTQIKEILRDASFLISELKPLTQVQTVSGIIGKRFIDIMKGSTSPGFPLSGRKDEWYVDVVAENQQPLVNVHPMFWEKVEQNKKLILEGFRFYSIFKGCLKDQATKLDDDKVRVYQSAPLDLQLMIRMYFLPIVRILSLFPLRSECAVGINACSPEWEQMDNHIGKYGKNRILAGDYSKYDLRMSPILVFTAFQVLITIAEMEGTGYTTEDIEIMKGIATEVAYPIIAYNGDLIEVHGGNPSGHNLTVYVNSIVNSLLFRCGFADKYGVIHRFDEAVALMTYGDDAKSSVKEDFEDSNHISYAEFLSTYDIVFTMPDKTSAPTKFMHDSDADFLKRKSFYMPELDCVVGQLDENSIFRSLHCVTKSKNVTEEEVCGSVIDSALTEWFYHGREVYDDRREKLQQIVQKHDLLSYTSQVSKTFDERVEEWKLKHRMEPVIEED
jgi:hypothetical protein